MELVLATHSPGKLEELRRLLLPFAVELRSAADVGVELPEETGHSYVDNATLKALAAARAHHCLALGDDAGLAVECLGDEPGVQTARYTARLGGAAAACADLALRTGLLAGATPVRARMHCALALAHPSGRIDTAHGVVVGCLRWPASAAPGLAAIFVPDPPSAVLEAGVLLHRRRAFEQLTPALIAALTPAGR